MDTICLNIQIWLLLLMKTETTRDNLVKPNICTFVSNENGNHDNK